MGLQTAVFVRFRPGHCNSGTMLGVMRPQARGRCGGGLGH